MLDAAKGRRWREALLAKLNNSEELGAWLRKQPHEVAVAFAARMALRVLPIAWTARGAVGGDLLSRVILPVFRATAHSWAVAKYQPAPETELARAARPARALVFGPR